MGQEMGGSEVLRMAAEADMVVGHVGRRRTDPGVWPDNGVSVGTPSR